MISERSCDTEDWSNDTENSALFTAINYILTFTQKTSHNLALQLYVMK